MSYAAAINYGAKVGGLSGVRCFGDEAAARRRLASMAGKDFIAEMSRLQWEAQKRVFELEANARELADGVLASFHSEIAAVMESEGTPEARQEAIKSAEATRDGALSVIASDLNAQVKTLADDLATTCAPIVAQRDAAVQAAIAQLRQVGDVWVLWPEAAGPFPSLSQLDEWLIIVEHAEGVRAIEESGGMNADTRAIAIATLPIGHPTRVKAEAAEAQIAALAR